LLRAVTNGHEFVALTTDDKEDVVAALTRRPTLLVEVRRALFDELNWQREGLAPGPNGNHLGLTTRLADGSEWLVDVGLGEGPAGPLPLAHGVYDQHGFTYTVSPSTFDTDGWRLEHDVRGSFLGVDFSRAVATTSDFLAMHETLSTSPSSRFVKVVSISRRATGGIDGLRGCVFSRITPSGVERRDVGSADEWWGLVVDHFELEYRDISADERLRLWTRLHKTHDAWDAAGRP
jgi:N-hydroxyarylamine O-acetyltransferase